MRGLDGDRRHVGRPVRADAGQGPVRHPPARAETAGRRAVRRRWRGRSGCGRRAPPPELLVDVGESGPQRVEEHQPVLRPLGGPGGGEERETGGRVLVPYGGEQGDPFGEQALVPQDPHRLRVPGGREGASRPRTAEGEPPLGVEPGQPQPARPREPEGRGPQVGAGPGRVEERGQGGGRRLVPLLVGERQPLGEQFGEVGRRAAPPGGRGRGPAGEQLAEAPPGRLGQRRARVLRRGLRQARGGPGAQPALRRTVCSAAASSSASAAAAPAGSPPAALSSAALPLVALPSVVLPSVALLSVALPSAVSPSAVSPLVALPSVALSLVALSSAVLPPAALSPAALSSPRRRSSRHRFPHHRPSPRA